MSKLFSKSSGARPRYPVFELLWALKTKVNVDEELLDCGRTLDKFYIPAKYPKRFPLRKPLRIFHKKGGK